MIDINQYRCHIGLFRQKLLRKKFLLMQQSYKPFWNQNQTNVKILFAILLILCLMLYPPWTGSYPSYTSSSRSMPHVTTSTPWRRLWPAWLSCSRSSNTPGCGTVTLTWSQSWQTCPRCSSSCCMTGIRTASLSWSDSGISWGGMYWSACGSRGVMHGGWGTGNQTWK